ncbi:TPA: hypothetical protein OX949_004318 [Escherichia coli]|uniref:hypothetical protein n=1 Tax=Enterobacteriaceae TaxID=543 RepID=UPI001276E6C0|nr:MULTISPECIES: hypothetical protein [Enterobacteriaceae]EBM5157420.1 hypothetical protein [Salmonella enterica]EHL7069092.1 hypothetical protein [Salmonella enterica]MBJ8951104.1 hypothetical protein [Citrobacter koseri]HAL6146327.1 hypothetical protein [Escherichia coli]HCW7068781.1 hypothetical protein [Escherichia coli]
MSFKPTPEEVKQARIKAGFTQQEAAERFGFTLSAWQAKETSGKTSRGLAAGTYELLLLLADDHPDYQLVNRGKKQDKVTK